MTLIAFDVYGPVGIVWAAILGAVGLWSATRVSSKLILSLYRARPLAPDELPELHRIMRALAQRAGLPAVPQLYYLPSRLMNAFTVGTRDDAAITVTDALVRGLTLRQIAGVLAHEVSHIRNGDLRVMALADVLTRLTSFMSTVGLLTLIWHLPVIIAGGGRVPWLSILALVFAPTLGGLIQLALSRAREYDADLDAAGITGDPEGLASALVTLEQRQGKLWEGLFLPGSRLPDPSILRSHPRTDDRVARLLALRPAAQPVFAVPEQRPEFGRSIVPVVRPPHFHVGRLGLWY